MKRVLVLGGVMAALATSAPAAAQTELGVTAGLFSSYVWRGLTLTSGPVLQPDISLSFPLGAASLTVGGWGNVEIGGYDDADDVTQGGGSSFNLSEVDPYAEVAFGLGKASIALGGVAYLYTNDDTAPANSSVNTVEVYGSIGIDALLSPSISVYYDLDKVKGLYIEGGVSHGIPLGATTLSLGATGGFSNNMDPDPDDVTNNFADNGFTHLDLHATVDFEAGPVSISPTLHFQINGDDATKYKGDDTKIWGGVSISWGRGFGGKAHDDE